MKVIDLNADIGEGFDDVPLLPYLTSVNIACGGHAGSVELMRSLAVACKRNGITIGAHPGYEDSANFGRRAMQLPFEELFESIKVQINRLAEVLLTSNQTLHHVKPHGALYHQACHDSEIASCIVEAVVATDQHLCMMCPDPSELERAARRAGLVVIAEAFADRTYQQNGFLSPRSLTGSCIADPLQALDQARKIVYGEKIPCLGGGEILVNALSLCVHGDSPGALSMTKLIRESLTKENVAVKSYLEIFKKVNGVQS